MTLFTQIRVQLKIIRQIRFGVERKHFFAPDLTELVHKFLFGLFGPEGDGIGIGGASPEQSRIIGLFIGFQVFFLYVGVNIGEFQEIGA